MKQSIAALTSLVGATLGLSDAQAAIVANDVLSANAPNTLSVRMQKAIFAFSQDRASLTMALIEDWTAASADQREAMARNYLDAFFAAANDTALTSDVGPSLLLADALGNAKALVAEKSTLSTAALDAVVDQIKASLMRTAYNGRGELLVPYIPQKLAWGQHGQHFPNLLHDPLKQI